MKKSSEHILPQNIQAENSIIGALLLDSEAFDRVSSILSDASFYEESNRVIYQAISRIKTSGELADVTTVVEYLTKEGRLDKAGGIQNILSLTRDVASTANIEKHADIVSKKAKLRDLIKLMSEVEEGAYAENDIDELSQMLENRLYDMQTQSVKHDYSYVDDVVKKVYQNLYEAQSRGGALSGIPSGYHRLDSMTCGWQKSDLIIIAARPAMGKTAFVISMVRNMIESGHAVGFFSLEMSETQIMNRLISNVCSISGASMKSGNLNLNEWKQLDIHVNKIMGKPLYIDDTSGLSVFELASKVRKMVKEHGVQIVMIDYLQLMNAKGASHGNRQEEVSIISRTLKGLAKEMNIPIIALSQLNRSVEHRLNGSADADSVRPQLSDLRESGAIEQDADMVCFIHRPDYYKVLRDKNPSVKGVAEVLVAKHRSGEIGDVKLRFEPEFTRFSNTDDVGGVEEKESGQGASRSALEEDIPMPTLSDSPF